LFVVSVRGGDDVREVLLLHDIVEPGEIWFVGVGWGQQVGNERRGSTSEPSCESGWVDDSSDSLGCVSRKSLSTRSCVVTYLNIQVCLDTRFSLVIGRIRDDL
jgi:hypothetical protein